VAVSRRNEIAPRHARVALDRRKMRITRLSWREEESQHGFTVMGLYYFRPGVFDAVEAVPRGSRHSSTAFLKYAMEKTESDRDGQRRGLVLSP
jgi:dTDP-glucose pyrophosphorylase